MLTSFLVDLFISKCINIIELFYFAFFTFIVPHYFINQGFHALVSFKAVQYLLALRGKEN